MDDPQKFRGNSHSEKNQTPKPKAKKGPDLVLSSPPKVGKASVWSRLGGHIFSSDGDSVASVVWNEVVIPTLKNLFYDTVTRGAAQAVFGDGRPSSTRPGPATRNLGGSGYHRPVSRGGDRDTRREPLDRRSRATHNFKTMTFPNIRDAEATADYLIDYIREYDHVSVAELYDKIGITPDFPDYNFGWRDLTGIRVRQVRDGFILDLPPTEQLDN